MGDALAELAAEIFYEDQASWPALLPSLMQLVRHPGASQREISLEVFARIAESVTPTLKGQLGVLVEIFQASLSDTVEVRLAALKALTAFLGCLEESEAPVFHSLLPSILVAVSDPLAVAPQAETQTKEMLEILVEVAEYNPRFFRPAVNNIASYMVALASAGSGAVADSLRHVALEWLCTLAEAKPTMARKVNVTPNNGGAAASFAQASMQVCFALMLEIEEDPEWATSEEEVSESLEVQSEDVGSQALDRLARALGPKQAIPAAFDLVNQMLQREANGEGWRFAYVALLAMCQTVEGGMGTEFAAQMQAQVVTCASRLLHHTSPRVRFMALQALGQLLLDHGPNVQREHHAEIVPMLCQSMSEATNPSPRVRSHAAAATINFIDLCEASELVLHLNALLTAALGVMQAGPRIAQEQAVAVVSASALVMDSDLGEDQYSMLMPFLQQALAQCPPGEDYRMLKGRLIECISLLGAAVPKERFAGDVAPVMAAMALASQQGMEADDPTKQFILKAWVRIGKVLGEGFVPYLDAVMPSLLHAIESPVETELTEQQIEDEDAEVDSDTECVIQNSEGRWTQVRTSALEEQAAAAQSVVLLAESLGPHFLPYVERCAKGLAPLAATSVYDDVRAYSMAALPELMSCSSQALERQAGQTDARWQPVRELLAFFLARLLEALVNEGEMEVLLTAMQSIKQCVENACRADWSFATSGLSRSPLVPAACRPLLLQEELEATSSALLRCLAESIQRRATARAEAVTDEDYDEEQAEADQRNLSSEEELQFNISECLGALFKTHGSAFLPIFMAEWLPRLRDMSDASCFLPDRKLSAFIYCDALEFCGEASAPLLDTVMPLLLMGVDSEEPTLRQPCAYGVGAAAAHATNALGATEWVPHCLQRLVAAVGKAGAREGTQEPATDNVVSALGELGSSMAAHPALAQDGDALWTSYLEYLPMRGDLEEGVKVLTALAQRTRAGDSVLLGEQRQRLPKAFAILCTAVDAPGSTEALHREVAETAKALAASLPPDQMEILWSNMAPDVAQKVRAIVA